MVERFFGPDEPWPNEAGELVRHSDYADLERQIAELRASPPPSGDVVNDGERCDNCGRNYAVIYRVPNDLWSKIAPHKDTLGPHSEHQGGGLLCPDCASAEADKIGITLRFDADTEWSSAPATADGWKLVPVEPTSFVWIDKLYEAVDLIGKSPNHFTMLELSAIYKALIASALPAAPTADGRAGEMSEPTVEELRKAAHEAPLAKIYETHTGHKFIGVHTDAWWKASQDYFRALEKRKPRP